MQTALLVQEKLFYWYYWLQQDFVALEACFQQFRFGMAIVDNQLSKALLGYCVYVICKTKVENIDGGGSDCKYSLVQKCRQSQTIPSAK